MKPPNADCRACKFSEKVVFEGREGHVCYRNPPVDHPILGANQEGKPLVIGMMSFRAALKPGEWCYQFEADLLKTSAIMVTS